MEDVLAKLDHLQLNSGPGGPVINAGGQIDDKNPLLGLGDVEIKWIDNNIGRGIFAKKNFAKGDVLLKDHPIVSTQFAWNSIYKYRACEYCLRALESAEENCQRLTGNPSLKLDYPECCQTNQSTFFNCPNCDFLYCSQNCFENASKEYHNFLCYGTKNPPESHPLIVLDNYWRNMHYPPETFNIMLIVKLLVRLHFGEGNSSLFARLTDFCSISNTEEKHLAEKFFGKEYLERISELRLLVLNVLNKIENIENLVTPDRFFKMLLLIGRNGQGIATSPFSTWVQNVEKKIENENFPQELKDSILKKIDDIYSQMDSHVGDFLDNEGSGLFPNQSIINHSCLPNCEIRFPEKNHLVGVVVIREIAQGEEITISYIEECQLDSSRYSRNKYLMNHYFFTCNCEKCLSQMDQDNCTSEEEEEDDEDSMED